MNAFPIGTSAISVARRAIDVIGQNVANAATPGYSRQAVQLENRVTGSLGSGVDVASVTRFAAPAVRTAILAGNSDRAALDTRLEVRRQIEATFGAGTGGVGDALNGFFDQVEQLTGRPDNTAARRPLLTAASDVAARLQSSAGDIDRLRSDLVNRAPQEVSALNDLAKKVADLNLSISIREQGGEQANDLRDQRDRFVNDISTKIDVRVVPQPFGVVNVIATGAPVVVGEFAGSFQVATDASNNLVVSDSGTGQPITFTGGSLGALVREVNVEIPATRARLDAFAGELIRRTNALQATGLGLGGPIASTAGSVSLNSASAPLASAGVPFPLTAGALTVSVTDTATGTRTNTTLAIDPATQSLNDIAAALSGVPGLTATVTAPSNSLTLGAQPGFAFDFAGRDTNPPGGGAVANTDTAGLLPALGLNGLFAGTGAANIAVRPELLADPNRFASGRTGQPGDGTNLERFSALRDTPVLNGRTLAADFADQAAAIGSAVSGLDDQQTAQGNLMRALFAEEQSVAGVDENEEFVRLLDFQRMIQGASRYLSVVNSALDEVINIVK